MKVLFTVQKRSRGWSFSWPSTPGRSRESRVCSPARRVPGYFIQCFLVVVVCLPTKNKTTEPFQRKDADGSDEDEMAKGDEDKLSSVTSTERLGASWRVHAVTCWRDDGEAFSASWLKMGNNHQKRARRKESSGARTSYAQGAQIRELYDYCN